MALYLWLSIFACVSCCFLSEAEEYDGLLMDDASATLTEGSIHGFRPCLDESCSAETLDSEADAALTWHVLSAAVKAYKVSHRVHDSENHESDVVVQHCMPLHKSTVDRFSSIEARHPDIRDVKMKVVEDFIRFVSDFAYLNTTGCVTPMNLIGYMGLAVRSLEMEYSQHCGDHCTCVFTAGVEDYMASTSTTESPTTTTMDQSTTESLPLGDEGYRPPCPEDSAHDSYEETYAEDQHHTYGSMLVGSIRGVPGVNFPNYTDIPLTSFSCADKKYIPGFYADLETDCQVFHVCYEHRRESFLCPLGTVFNQPILACDYWYSSNCSHAKDYYEVNVKSEEEVKEEAIEVIKEIIKDEKTEVTEEHSESTDEVYEAVDTKQVVEEHSESTEVQEEMDIRQFLPVKAKVIDFEKPIVKGEESVATEKQTVQDVQEVASEIFSKIVSTATDVVSAARVVIDKVPQPEMKLKPSSLDLSGEDLKQIISPKVAGVKFAVPAAKVAFKSALPVAKIVAAKKVVPFAAAVATAKVAAVKTAIPVVSAKKIVPLAAKAAVAASVPVAAKVAAKAAVAASVPVAAKVAVKTAVPVAIKASAVKAAVPVAAKAKLLAVPAKKVAISGVKVAATVPKLAVPALKAKKLTPIIKGKALKVAAVPVLKAKILPVKAASLAGLAPLAKAKLIKTAAISPLTKKTLALGYMKLLKAKKLALMG